MSQPAPTSPGTWSDLGIRVASAVVLIPLALYCNWAGGWWFITFVLALGLAIAHEWTNIVCPGNMPQLIHHMAAALCAVLLPESMGLRAALTVLLILTISSALIYQFVDKVARGWAYFGILYVGLPCLCLVALRHDSVYGAYAVLWLFLVVWAADITAYFAGRLIGGPKLAPRISPKKTWAGLVGAIAGSVIAATLFSGFTGLPMAGTLIVLAGLMAVVEQAGDLFESALKRAHNVKDSGQLIPGHGGVIDRVDGLIAAVFVAVIIGLLHSGGASAAQGLLLW
jgi:phosphatidate cytidylyltransferase